MERTDRIEVLRAQLVKMRETKDSSLFPTLFPEFCAIFELDVPSGARLFDTSQPNFSRWMRGIACPPAALIIASIMIEEIDERKGL